MQRYINEPALLKAVEGYTDMTKADLLYILEDIPTADVEEVWHGRWVRQCDGTHYCSVCGLSSTYTLYGAEVLGLACPHCGAKMEEGDEG